MSERISQPEQTPDHDLAQLLLITYESVGEKMAGPGVRAWEVARALGQHGVRVTLATPYPSTRSAPNVEICNFQWEDAFSITRLIDRADVVMGFSWVITRVNTVLGKPIEKPVIVDVYYVPEIEQLMLHLARPNTGLDPTPIFVQDMLIYLRQGDFFTCAGNTQYDYWVGALMAAGRVNPDNLRQGYNLDHLLAVVPFGIPQAPPAPGVARLKGVLPGIGVQDKVLYWGGGIWDWTDPFTLIDALSLINRERKDVRVVFCSLHHFSNQVVPEMDAARRLLERVQRENWLGSQVFFLDWVPYDQRSDPLLEADLGVSLMPRTLENRYAIRSRLLDHLWCGLPGVLSQGDEMASVLDAAGLARLVQPGDVAGVAQAILESLEQPDRRGQAQPDLAEVRARYVWTNAVLPVVEFLRHPQLAPDGALARSQIGALTNQRRESDALRAEQERRMALQDELRILRGSRPVRMADALGNWLRKVGIRL